MTGSAGDDSAITHEKYLFVVACKTCGVVDEATLTHEEASGPTEVETDPARIHYDRTGHTAGRINYTKAPPDIREMIDGGSPDDIDWPRVGEWLKGVSNR